MRGAKSLLGLAGCFSTLLGVLLYAQATGNIVGTVIDPSGARIPGATVTAEDRARGIRRAATSNEAGFYSLSSLPPGDYDLSAEQTGFRKATQRVTVNVGRDARADFRVEVGTVAEAVEVQGEASQINLVDSKVDAIISRTQIADLPLNGRNAYELAKLVPAVQVTPSTTRNTQVSISIGGRANTRTRVTVDGLSVVDFTQGGIAQNFSQEVVQEFQVSASNFDPSVGVTEAGKVSIVTRSGGNQFHGTLFGYFRDNEYAGFPGLGRPVPKPNPANDPAIAAFNEAQTSPDFYRRQFGGMLSGRIIPDRLFWLAAVEATSQLAVATFDPNFAQFQPLARIKPQPLHDFLQNYRVDWRANDNHSFFWRFSRQRFLGRKGEGFPDSEGMQYNRSYTALMGWTAVWTPSFISDLRVGFDRAHILQRPVSESVGEARLLAPLLPYIGNINVSGTNMVFGARNNIPNESLTPRIEIAPNFSYVRGNNTWKFGFDIERHPYWLLWQFDSPYSGSVFNPQQARDAGISVPSVYDDLGDLFQLPLSTFAFGVGKSPVLPTYNPDPVWVRHRYYFYGGSSYRATPRLTLNWAVTYSYEDGVVNWDIPKPKSLARVLGGDLKATRRDTNNIGPIVGFAWDPVGKGQTVIRGGFGMYYGTFTPNPTSRERAIIAPLGQSYVSVDGSFVTNPLTGRGVLAFPNAASNAAAGVFRLADLVRFLPAIRANLETTIFTGTNQDLSVTNFDFFKATGSGSSGGGSSTILMPDLTMPNSLQTMLGVQHQFGADWLVNVSGVYDVVNHVAVTWDRNRQFRPASQGGRVDPALSAVQVQESGGKALYKGLLVAVNKRMSRRFQLNTAYTLSSYKESNFSVDFDNLKDGFGPATSDRRNLLNINAVMQLPAGLQAALVSSFQSVASFNPFLAQLDLNGDGTRNDRLPGISQNEVNRGASKDDLRKAADNFNQTYAGKRDTLGTLVRPITLPANFRTGDSVITQDIRVTKKFRFGERVSTDLMAEIFNIFNFANLTVPSSAGNLYSSGFGRASARIDNLFGSAGPRAAQFGLRINF